MDQEKLLLMSDLREVWLFIQRNALLVGVITLGMAVFALVLSLILPPHYAGKAIVMLDPRKSNVTNLESVMSALPADHAAIRSEMDVIQSRAVANRVIDEVNLLRDSKFNPSMSVTGWIGRLFASSKEEAKAKREERDRTSVFLKLERALDVQNDGRSYSIVITYRDRNPERAAQIANSYADQYLVDQLEVKYEASQRATAWLAKRMESLRDEVRVAEKAVEDFKTANNLVNVGDETITQKQLSTINSQLLQARAERSQADARLMSVKNLSDEQLATSSIVLSSPLIQKLREQEAEVRRKEADLSLRYGNRHPKMIDVRNELQGIKDKIGEEILKTTASLQNDLDIAENKTRTLEKEMGNIEIETGTGNQAMVTLRQLQREAAATRSLYEGFLNRSKQIAEQQDMQVADARIIARADVPRKPYFPNMWVFLILGTVLGAVTGFITALILEYLDRGIRALSFIEKNYGVPALGLVPLAETAEGQLPTDYILEKPLSAYAEALRSIRTAIHFSNVDNPPKVMVVTSSLPNEGKTVFAASFARMLAKAGNRILLIDADMRRPRLHSLLSLDKTKPDLAMVLAGDAPLSQALQKDASGADVIIARTKTPNPQDLLNSRQMEKLLAGVRQDYDMVIIDTPPVMAVSDSALASKLADCTVYVVRWASTPREVVSESLKQFANYNIKLTGVVLTQVDLQQQKQYGYGDYGYYYGHYKNYYAN
jgi:succinoglycan biosynthesis transport protein ExoP